MSQRNLIYDGEGDDEVDKCFSEMKLLLLLLLYQQVGLEKATSYCGSIDIGCSAAERSENVKIYEKRRLTDELFRLPTIAFFLG